jgi:cytochrome c biogenesis protein CcdA
MTGLLLGAVLAFWLGILTSISPCPLATNILTISYIDRKIGQTRVVLLTGLLYTLGRMLTYTVLASLIVFSILAQEKVAFFLQRYMYKLLGPVFIIVGMILLELINFKIAPSVNGQKMEKIVESCGIWAGGLLGIIFALAFCPTSAAFFFLSLIPLSIKNNSALLLPAVYGLGTALPVIFFAFLIAIGAKWISSAFNKLQKVELWLRRITGVIFILAGIYYCLTYIFELL